MEGRERSAGGKPFRKLDPRHAPRADRGEMDRPVFIDRRGGGRGLCRGEYRCRSRQRSDRCPAEVKGLKELKLADVRVSREGIGTPQCLIFRPDVTPRRGTRVGVSVPLKGWTSPNLEYVVEFY